MDVDISIDKGDHETLLATAIILVTGREGHHHPSEEVEESLAIMMISTAAAVALMTAAVVHHRMTVDGTGKEPTRCLDKVSDYNAFCQICFFVAVVIPSVNCCQPSNVAFLTNVLPVAKVSFTH
jgi:hypothetical protein